MSTLSNKNFNNKSDVIERYWPDYLSFCMRDGQYINNRYVEIAKLPTIDEFWRWYITSGPMGVKHANRLYNEDRVEYV